LLYILEVLTPPVILSIAGYDPSSGAGITADVKTAAALGCYAVSCPTALTVQSTQGVFGVDPVRPAMVREMLNRLAEDVEITAVRIGMLGSGPVARVVAEFLEKAKSESNNVHNNVVLDPVIRSSSGAELVDPEGLEVIRKRLLPLSSVVTPNVEEAAVLAGAEGGWGGESESWTEALPRLRSLAETLHELGCRALVITGGHLAEANDYLSYKDAAGVHEQAFTGSHLESKSTHGTGCAFATALACGLALGRPLPEAVGQAKEYVRRAIQASYPVGKGVGPMNHLFGMEK
jgi:hydroxymethylpyrimidine/phosphomethylpyrimidine kinase